MSIEFKLKGQSNLDLKEGEKIECEVEGIEGGKVVLVRVPGQKEIRALNANCTHFGAPLKNGVLTPDGRLTCPWHGACFNTATGDVEDAPAPDPLNRFDVFEKDGAVYVKGQESDIKNGRRQPDVKCSATGNERVVIVGGGSGGFGAMQALRENGFRGYVTLIGDEGYLPVDRTKLSKALMTDPAKLALRTKDWYSGASIDMVDDTVTSVDFSKKEVSTKSGKPVPYTKLILASGGTPKRLPLPGLREGDLSDIFVLRNVFDVQKIMEAVGEKGKKIAIIGSSFIGMEVANALAKDNTVSVIGMEGAPLERIMGNEVGQIFQKNAEKAGVTFYMNASVDSAVGSGKVRAVKLKDGTEIEADLVILGTGVGPATEYLRDNGSVQLEKDGSLAVDENFSVKGLSDVYALGDIATYPYHGPGGDGKPVRIEHWNVAQNSGRLVARLIAKPGSKAKPFIPVFWSAQGGQLRYCGHTPEGFDEVIVKGQPEESKFAAYYAKGDEIVAVASMGMDPIVMKCAELMRRGEMLSKSQIKEGEDVLQAKF